MSKLGSRLAVVLPPVVLGIVLLVAWEQWVVLNDIKPYLMPKPSAIRTQFGLLDDVIRRSAWITGKNAVIGLFFGILVGVAMALVASRLRFFRDMVTPVSAALNAVPLIAITPILNNAIGGGTSQLGRRIVVALVVFFPIFVNTLKGLSQVDPTHAELMRSYAASSNALSRKVRVPNALPYFFTGFKVAASGAVISAVVAEYFGGPQGGLGYFIATNAAQSRTPQAWSFVVAACAMGLSFFLLAVALERVAMPWRAKQSAAG
ncbi:ABC transporter permease [soil metagenome]